MSIKEHNDLQSIKLKPIISYPREAQVGKSYLMSIDVELATSETPWPYPEEEYAISFILETRPFFSYEPLGGHEPSIVLHRFGGTYGPAEYLLTAAREEVPKGTIGITFVNGWGIPIANMELECEVKQEVELDLQRELTITRKNRSLLPQAASREEERQPALASKIETVSAAERIVREAREHIETQLREAGWLLEDYASLNASSGQSVAVRNFIGLPDDYLLIVNGEQAGVIKVRRTGEPLAGIEEPVPPVPFSAPIPPQVHQATLFPRSVLSFVYESTGIETRFTSYLDPEPRSRRVFTFHRPETLALWLSQAPPDVPSTSNDVLRSRLRRMPPVQRTGLRGYQVGAITNLEKSLAENRPRALIQMATGAGKTQTAVSSIYRLLKYGGARRVLYLVDRTNLAQQMLNQFRQYITPDTGRKFTELYHVQRLQDNKLDPSASACISTIQRLDSMLVLQPEIDRIVEEGSSFEQEDLGEDDEPRAITYNPAIPIEYFDIIVIDECHRSIYGKWRPVIEYFDAFIIGITGILDNNRVRSFFNNNVVYEQKELELPIQVFISYARENGEEVKYLQQQLKIRGMRIWSDSTDLPIGASSRDEIVHAIEKSDVFIIYITQRSIESDLIWSVEVSTALRCWEDDRSFNIIPIYQGVTPAEVQRVCSSRGYRSFTEFNGITLSEYSISKNELTSNKAIKEIANRTLGAAFSSRLNSIEASRNYEPWICLRTFSSIPSTTSLDIDLDWTEFFTDRLPSQEEWQETLFPALRDTRNVLMNWKLVDRLHLFVQARTSSSFAFGFIFSTNRRITLILESNQGSWSTKEALSETSPLRQTSYEQQDNEEKMIDNDDSEKTVDESNNDKPLIAVVEVAISRSTSSAVTHYLATLGISFNRRIRFEPHSEPSNYSVENARQALAMASQIGKEVKRLCDKENISHIHLFCSLPSRLAVLLGHQLNNITSAITLYEYIPEDRTYISAYTLDRPDMNRL